MVHEIEEAVVRRLIELTNEGKMIWEGNINAESTYGSLMFEMNLVNVPMVLIVQHEEIDSHEMQGELEELVQAIQSSLYVPSVLPLASRDREVFLTSVLEELKGQ